MNYVEQDSYGMYAVSNSNGPRLMGNDVYNRQDEDQGDIKEIMLDVAADCFIQLRLATICTLTFTTNGL